MDEALHASRGGKVIIKRNRFEFEPIECIIPCILKYETDYQIGDERLVIESRHLVPVSAPVESFPSPAKSLLLVSLRKRSRGQSIGNDLQFLFSAR